MRLLVFSQHFWPETFPINDISQSLSRSEVSLEVLTGKPNYPGGRLYSGHRAWGCKRERFHEITVNRVPLIPRGNGVVKLAMNYISFVISAAVFAPILLRKKRFDVIFVYATSPILQAIPALLLGQIKKAPVVIWVQDLWPESLSATGYVRNKWVLKLVERAVRMIYRRADLILVQSEAFIDPVRALASDTPIEYHPNSVSRSFAEAPTTEAPRIAEMNGNFSVMFAGNIGRAQAVDIIVDAAARLKDYEDVRFIIVGDGSAKKQMQKRAADLRLPNLCFTGKFPLEVMPGLLQEASVLLVTLADREIFKATVPSKLQAYLAAGRPVIACLNGEGARLVEVARAGLACPAEDSEELAQTVLRLYRMPAELRDAMGINGRRYYRDHFDHEVLVDKLIARLSVIAQSGSVAS